MAQLGILTVVVLGSVNVGQQFSSASHNASFGKIASLSQQASDVESKSRDFGKTDAPPSPFDFTLMVITVIGTHMPMLWAGHALESILGLVKEDRIAVRFAGSQKPLIVGLHLAVSYFGGIAILPMVTYHVCQLPLHTVVTDRVSDALATPRHQV